MEKKKILGIISVIGTIAGLGTVLLDAKINFEHSDKFHTDMELFNKGFTLKDEYDSVEDSYYSWNMTKDEHVMKLKELVPRFKQHLDEMDSHLWVEDAISDRRMIADILESMKKEIQNWEIHVILNRDK